MHKAMAVLYRAIDTKHKDRYSIVAYDGKETDIMKDMPLAVCFSSIVFFYNLGMDLSQAMMNSLEEEEIVLLHQQILGENGDGINHFSDSLKEILHDLKISLN